MKQAYLSALYTGVRFTLITVNSSSVCITYPAIRMIGLCYYMELAYLENGSEFAIHQKGYEPTEVYEHSLLEGSGDI